MSEVTCMCPNCKIKMEKVVQPDITTDRCPKCKSIFLDKSELNVLATGMAGNIEYCAADDKSYNADSHPVRDCPKCHNSKMEKINLLQFTDIIFDYCPKCNGFFLDKGEVKDMNAKLQKFQGTKFSQEYRSEKDHHLVRIDIFEGVSLAPLMKGAMPIGVEPIQANSLQITVYFTPLNLGLHVYDEPFLFKLAKVFHISKQDINTGDPEFDSKFFIQGNEEDRVKKIFNKDTQQRILDFVAKKPKLFFHTGRIKIFDNRIVYLEGLYSDDINIDQDKAFKIIVNDLINIAKSIEKYSA